MGRWGPLWAPDPPPVSGGARLFLHSAQTQFWKQNKKEPGHPLGPPGPAFWILPGPGWPPGERAAGRRGGGWGRGSSPPGWDLASPKPPRLCHRASGPGRAAGHRVGSLSIKVGCAWRAGCACSSACARVPVPAEAPLLQVSRYFLHGARRFRVESAKFPPLPGPLAPPLCASGRVLRPPCARPSDLLLFLWGSQHLQDPWRTFLPHCSAGRGPGRWWSLFLSPESKMSSWAAAASAWCRPLKGFRGDSSSVCTCGGALICAYPAGPLLLLVEPRHGTEKAEHLCACKLLLEQVAPHVFFFFLDASSDFIVALYFSHDRPGYRIIPSHPPEPGPGSPLKTLSSHPTEFWASQTHRVCGVPIRQVGNIAENLEQSAYPEVRSRVTFGDFWRGGVVCQGGSRGPSCEGVWNGSLAQSWCSLLVVDRARASRHWACKPSSSKPPCHQDPSFSLFLFSG